MDQTGSPMLTFSRMMFTVIAVGGVAALSGCGGRDTLEGYPPPGEMRVVSVEPVEDAGSAGLVHQFSFENWFPGAPRPTGPFLTPGRTTQLFPASRAAADGEICLRIEWYKPDSKWSENGRFGVIMDDLEPETTYEVSVHAAAVATLPVHVEAFGRMDDRLIPMALPVLTMRAEPGMKKFAGRFSTGITPETLLVFSCFDVPEGKPYKIVVDDLRVVRVGPAAYPPLDDPEGVNQIPNGSFEVWPAGRPKPEGPWQAPAGTSAIEPYMRRMDDGLRSVHHVWEADDSGDSPEALFGVDVDGLHPETEYVFSCEVDALKKFAADVAVYGRDENGALQIIKDPLVTVRPGGGSGFVEHSGRFVTGKYTAVRLAVRGPGPDATYPNRVLWDKWQLFDPTAKTKRTAAKTAAPAADAAARQAAPTPAVE